VLGLIILRVKEPLLERFVVTAVSRPSLTFLGRPYKTWIVTPITFCAVALFLLCMPVSAAPLEAAAVAGKSAVSSHSQCSHSFGRFCAGRNTGVLYHTS
jgi:hypothetical protein